MSVMLSRFDFDWPFSKHSSEPREVHVKGMHEELGLGHSTAFRYFQIWTTGGVMPSELRLRKSWCARMHLWLKDNLDRADKCHAEIFLREMTHAQPHR